MKDLLIRVILKLGIPKISKNEYSDFINLSVEINIYEAPYR
jgi:hypothetical protein